MHCGVIYRHYNAQLTPNYAYNSTQTEVLRLSSIYYSACRHIHRRTQIGASPTQTSAGRGARVLLNKTYTTPPRPKFQTRSSVTAARDNLPRKAIEAPATACQPARDRPKPMVGRGGLVCEASAAFSNRKSVKSPASNTLSIRYRFDIVSVNIFRCR